MKIKVVATYKYEEIIDTDNPNFQDYVSKEKHWSFNKEATIFDFAEKYVRRSWWWCHSNDETGESQFTDGYLEWTAEEEK